MLGDWTHIDIAKSLYELSKSLPGLTEMIIALSYLMGFWLFFRGVYKLKQYGELRTMMSTNTDLREPILLFTAGALLLFLPSGIIMAERTFFAHYTATPIGYDISSATTEWDLIQKVVYALVRIVGLIAFIKGVLILSNAGSQAMGQNTLGKALTHLIGGVFAINISGTVAMIEKTFNLPPFN